MFVLRALAEGHKNGVGSQNRAGAGENFTRGTDQQRRGNESMSSFYHRTGQSALGGNARTRGRLAPIGQGRRRGR